MRPRSAFSLLEVIIAALVCSTVVILAMGVWTTHYKAIGKSKNLLLASHIAQQEMEACIAGGYNNLANRSDDVTLRSRSRGVDATTTFHYDVKVTDRSTGFRNVVVSVSWNEPGGQKKLLYEAFIYRTSN